MTTKIIEPGGSRYLGLAEQRLSAIKVGGVPAKQKIKVGDAEIIVSTGPTGDRIEIRVGAANLMLHPVRGKTYSWSFFEDRHPTFNHKLKRGHELPRPSAPAYYWDASVSVPMATGEYVVFPMVDQTQHVEHTYPDTSSTDWFAMYPAICKPGLVTGEIQTNYGLYSAINLVYHNWWFQAPIGQDANGDPWIVYMAPISYIDATYKHSAIISKMNLRTGYAEIIWPRFVGKEYGFASTICVTGRGKIAFFFNEYSGDPGDAAEMPTSWLITADVFADTWTTANCAAIPAFQKTEATFTWLNELMFSDITSPSDGVLVAMVALRRYENSSNLPQTVYECRIARSTDYGASWTNLTSSIPGGFSGNGYWAGSLGYGDKLAFSPKPGHVLLETGFSNAADTVIQYLQSSDGGATFSQSQPVYTQNDVCHVAGTSLYAVATLPSEYSLDYGTPTPFPDADVPITLHLFDDYLCQNELWNGPVAVGNFYSPYFQNRPIRPKTVCYGKTAPLMPGHPGRLELP